jgi:hypothetical protein
MDYYSCSLDYYSCSLLLDYYSGYYCYSLAAIIDLQSNFESENLEGRICLSPSVGRLGTFDRRFVLSKKEREESRLGAFLRDCP